MSDEALSEEALRRAGFEYDSKLRLAMPEGNLQTKNRTPN